MEIEAKHIYRLEMGKYRKIWIKCMCNGKIIWSCIQHYTTRGFPLRGVEHPVNRRHAVGGIWMWPIWPIDDSGLTMIWSGYRRDIDPAWFILVRVPVRKQRRPIPAASMALLATSQSAPRLWTLTGMWGTWVTVAIPGFWKGWNSFDINEKDFLWSRCVTARVHGRTKSQTHCLLKIETYIHINDWKCLVICDPRSNYQDSCGHMMVQGTLWQASTKSLASTEWHFLATRSMGLTQPSTLETWQSPTNFVLADPVYTCPKRIVHQNHQRFPSQNWNPTIYV